MDTIKLLGVVPLTIDAANGDRVVMGSANVYEDERGVFAEITLPSTSKAVLDALGITEPIVGFSIDGMHATAIFHNKETH